MPLLFIQGPSGARIRFPATYPGPASVCPPALFPIRRLAGSSFSRVHLPVPVPGKNRAHCPPTPEEKLTAGAGSRFFGLVRGLPLSLFSLGLPVLVFHFACFQLQADHPGIQKDPQGHEKRENVSRGDVSSPELGILRRDALLEKIEHGDAVWFLELE